MPTGPPGRPGRPEGHGRVCHLPTPGRGLVQPNPQRGRECRR